MSRLPLAICRLKHKTRQARDGKGVPKSPDCTIAPVEQLSYNVGLLAMGADSDSAVWQRLRFPRVTEQANGFSLSWLPSRAKNLSPLGQKTSPPKRRGKTEVLVQSVAFIRSVRH